MSALTLLVDSDDPTPPYEQLRRQLVDLVGAGVLRPGERLPSVRQLAGDLGLAAGTVARTYRELEAGGAVRTRRGGGTRVVDAPPRLGAGERQRRLAEHAAAYAQHAALLGATTREAVAAVEAALSPSTGSGAASMARTSP